MAKVIHVHLIGKRRDYYFASITAVYDVLTEEEVGVKKSYLLHAGLSGNGTVTTKTTLSKILCKWKQDSVVSLFLYLNSVFKHKHKLIHNQAPV